MNELIQRKVGSVFKRLIQDYPVITLTGPRQSGKTTLCRMTYPEMAYANLEDPEIREYAFTDPKGFLAQFPDSVILDEIQRVPELISYIQVIVDTPGFSGNYILTGSQNFSVSNTVNQSLAGRTALLTLLPLSSSEILNRYPESKPDVLIYQGGYPVIYRKCLNPTQVLGDYIATYVERDIRQLSMIRNLTVFQRFLGLCAGRTGQLLNSSSLSNDTGVSQTTVREWLSILEASYICFRLPPFYGNISKRLVKSPKLYFYDTGLAAYLMGINSISQLSVHPLRGMLFENLIVTEILKFILNRRMRPDLFFYRDSNGNEVDLVIPDGTGFVPVEIKSGATISKDFFKGLAKFSKAVKSPVNKLLVYGGNDERVQNGVQITGLHTLDRTLENSLQI
ncbi:MAG: ATP-binding protein [Candidatus Aegiribacteria sp.]|nr:ATP-binding protein [Candidatus Aegiribacteria sp.]